MRGPSRVGVRGCGERCAYLLALGHCNVKGIKWLHETKYNQLAMSALVGFVSGDAQPIDTESEEGRAVTIKFIF